MLRIETVLILFNLMIAGIVLAILVLGLIIWLIFGGKGGGQGE